MMKRLRRLWHTLNDSHRFEGEGVYRAEQYDGGVPVALEYQRCDCGSTRWDVTEAAVRALIRLRGGHA